MNTINFNLPGQPIAGSGAYAEQVAHAAFMAMGHRHPVDGLVDVIINIKTQEGPFYVEGVDSLIVSAIRGVAIEENAVVCRKIVHTAFEPDTGISVSVSKL